MVGPKTEKILLAVYNRGGEARFKEICEDTGVQKGTVARLAKLAVEKKFLEQSNKDGYVPYRLAKKGLNYVEDYLKNWMNPSDPDEVKKELMLHFPEQYVAKREEGEIILDLDEIPRYQTIYLRMWGRFQPAVKGVEWSCENYKGEKIRVNIPPEFLSHFYGYSYEGKGINFDIFKDKFYRIHVIRHKGASHILLLCHKNLEYFEFLVDVMWPKMGEERKKPAGKIDSSEEIFRDMYRRKGNRMIQRYLGTTAHTVLTEINGIAAKFGSEVLIDRYEFDGSIKRLQKRVKKRGKSYPFRFLLQF